MKQINDYCWGGFLDPNNGVDQETFIKCLFTPSVDVYMRVMGTYGVAGGVSMANGTKGRRVLVSVPYCGVVKNGATGLRNADNKKQILDSAVQCPSARRGYGYGFDHLGSTTPLFVPAQSEVMQTHADGVQGASTSSGPHTDTDSTGITIPDLNRVFSADAHSSVHDIKRRVLSAILFPQTHSSPGSSNGQSDGTYTYNTDQHARTDIAEDEELLQEARRRAATLWPSLVKSLPSPSRVRATATQHKATADRRHEAAIHAVSEVVEDFQQYMHVLRQDRVQELQQQLHQQESGHGTGMLEHRIGTLGHGAGALEQDESGVNSGTGSDSDGTRNSKRSLLAAAATNVPVGGACTTHTQCNQNSTDKYLPRNANKGAFCTGAKTCDTCSACQYDQTDSLTKVCPDTQCPGSGKFPGCIDAQKLGKDWVCPNRYNFSIYKYFSPSDNIQVAPSVATKMKYITPFNRLVGPIMVTQRRRKLEDCNGIHNPTVRNFSQGTDCQNPGARDGRPYGFDPILISSSSVFNGKVDADRYYVPSERINLTTIVRDASGKEVNETVLSTPFGFFPHQYDGATGQVCAFAFSYVLYIYIYIYIYTYLCVCMYI
jgi:hypothetical protein